MRILIVEDEEPIRDGLADFLAFHGYAPEKAEDGEVGLRRGKAEAFDLVLLDVMLPGKNGFDVCRELREDRPRLPILMLTAKGSEDDIIRGLQEGADDYVTKPFSLRELLARVEALLRRSGKLQRKNATFQFGPWEVDGQGLRATTRSDAGDIHIELTEREVALLRLFTDNAGRVVSRRRLLEDVWDMSNVQDIETRTIDVHIAKLRKKIDAGRPESLISAVRGAGYRARI